MSEKWLDICGYEGYYQISNFGNVKSLSRPKQSWGSPYMKKEIELKQCTGRNGYKKVVFSVDCIRKTFSVHRLVATAFILNLGNKPEVNHINEVKTDNRVENLEWATSKENTNHGSCIMKRAKSYSANNRNNKFSVKIAQISKNGDIIKIWPSKAEAIRAGYDSRNVNRCIKGLVEYSYGFKWKVSQ